jgi:asparagine synthase (glutamine-hydrolysing)
MCGIAGVYNVLEPERRLASMLTSLEHRGPDATGSYLSKSITGTALGHQRLSIIDLTTKANQPFVDGDLVLSYNGEIYNFRELRAELERQGERFRTQSDTEVVVKAWKVWGPGCLSRLHGMFAFALLNERTRNLYLARDHFGIKPLFYATHHNGVVFASESTAVLRAIPDMRIDNKGVVASLMYSWVPETLSVYRGLVKLLPGHVASISPDGRISVTKYWDPSKELATGNVEEPTTQELQQTLKASVKRHLLADVPVALLLSGGLDSSLIAAMMADIDPSIGAYTIAFRRSDQRFEAMPNDTVYARLVADQLDIELHEIEIQPDITNLWPEMVARLGEPIGDAAALNTYLISRAAREAGIKVLLSGMGADEFFGGYRKHYAALLATKYRRLPSAVRGNVIEPIVRAVPVATKNRGFRYARWARRFVDFASLGEEDAFQRSYALFSRLQLRSMLNSDLHPAIDELIDDHHFVYESAPVTDQVNRMCYVDSQFCLPSLNLAYTDRASMAASVEVRVPYVDVNVARLAFAIPGDRKIVGRQRKVALKEAARGLLSDEIIDRKKAPFGVPLRSWIRSELKDVVDELLVNGSLAGDGILNRSEVARIVEEDRKGVADYSQQIWQLLTVETWYQQTAATAPARP